MGQDTGWVVSLDFVSITVVRTYAGKIAVLPEQGAAHEEEVLEIEHGGHSVGKEAQEMWESDVGDAVGWKLLPTMLATTTILTAKRGKEAYLSRRSDGPSSLYTWSTVDQCLICIACLHEPGRRTACRSCSGGHAAALACRTSCNTAGVKRPLPRHVHTHPWFGCSGASHSGYGPGRCSMCECSRRAVRVPKH